MMPPKETLISLKWILILVNSLVWEIFLLILWPFSWVAENGFEKQSAVSHTVGRKASCSSAHLTGPSLQERLPPFGHDFQIVCVSSDTLLHSMLFFFTPFLFSCVCMGVLICVCAHKYVWACMCGGLRLIIKSQPWPILHLIHWGRVSHPTQGLSNQPRVSHPTQGLVAQLVSWARLL